MSFSATEFLPLSSMANSNAPRHWTYTTVDDKATVVGSGYFDDVATTVQVGDLIWSVDESGGTQTLTLVFVDAITSGVVTTLSSTLTLA